MDNGVPEGTTHVWPEDHNGPDIFYKLDEHGQWWSRSRGFEEWLERDIPHDLAVPIADWLASKREPAAPVELPRDVTVRDYFAGQALNGGLVPNLVPAYGEERMQEAAAEMARLCFLIADAMVKARQA